MSSGLFLIAERVLRQEGQAGLQKWEANLTPMQRRWADEDWREFIEAMDHLAKAAADAAQSLSRHTESRLTRKTKGV